MAETYESAELTPIMRPKKSAPVVPADTTELPFVCKTLEVVDVSGGTVLRYLPQGGDPTVPADWVTVTGVFVGYEAKCFVRRVGAGTTATVRAHHD